MLLKVDLLVQADTRQSRHHNLHSTLRCSEHLYIHVCTGEWRCQLTFPFKKHTDSQLCLWVRESKQAECLQGSIKNQLELLGFCKRAFASGLLGQSALQTFSRLLSLAQRLSSRAGRLHQVYQVSGQGASESVIGLRYFIFFICIFSLNVLFEMNTFSV